jgi:uncharacterized delta-60 repeat protein
MERLGAVGVVCAAVLAAGAPPAAAVGDLDNGFGNGGTLLVPVGTGGQSAGNGVAVVAGGGLDVGGEAIDGSASNLVLLRLDSNATPASLGTTLTPLGGDAAGAAIVVQGDGKAVVAGYGLGALGNSFGIVRFLPGGSLDTAGFGAAGVQQAAVGADSDSAARALAAYGPGELVAAGRALDAGVIKVALVRLSSNGSVDPGFSALFAAGDGGEATANAVATEGDGKVVAAGYALDGGVTKLALMRRLGNGSPDTEFGNPTGIVLMAIGDGREAIANALAIQPDGKLLVAGQASDGGATKVMLARFNADGSPDASFGSGGIVLTSVGDGDDVAASAVAVQPDGRIAVAGHATDSGGTDMMMARYHGDGSPDGSFGTGGVSLIPLGEDGTAEANALVLQGNRAVITGYASDGGENKTALAGVTLAGVTPPNGGGLPPDTTPPTLRASLTHTRFRVGGGTSAFGTRKRRTPIGTTFVYELSEAARVAIRLDRALPGVRRGKGCFRRQGHQHGRRCTRFVRVGQLVRASPRGKSHVPFNGRVKRKALPLGTYRAVLRATDAAGNQSRQRTLNFKLVA